MKTVKNKNFEGEIENGSEKRRGKYPRNMRVYFGDI
jgi:hypothetical protein